ncbi:MAG: SH3 domain-containing protein [Anaerolineae bacterium]|nr:SH3 domain-containing protein [Anaerolineae bacterium]
MNNKITRAAPILLMAASLALPRLALAQDPPAATPIPINLETPTPPPVAPGAAGAAATATWTATPASLAVLEPLDSANVRAEPDVNGAQLGVIRAGEVYTVTGRYFEWYQFQYNGSPTGRAWVFGQIVRIDGDPNTIPEVTLEPLPTQDPVQAAGTQTAEAIVLTPGGDLTATAASRGIVATLEIPGVSGAPRTQTDATTGEQTQLLPTFTYPPGIVMAATEPAEVAVSTDTPLLENIEFSSDDLRNIPPIVPILALGSLGMLGLMVSAFRRRK